jgi:hypothetical protein
MDTVCTPCAFVFVFASSVVPERPPATSSRSLIRPSLSSLVAMKPSRARARVTVPPRVLVVARPVPRRAARPSHLVLSTAVETRAPAVERTRTIPPDRPRTRARPTDRSSPSASTSDARDRDDDVERARAHRATLFARVAHERYLEILMAMKTSM